MRVGYLGRGLRLPTNAVADAHEITRRSLRASIAALLWPPRHTTPDTRSSSMLTVGGDDDGDDEAVDTEHTGHDHGHDGLHHQLRAHHAHGSDADARLGRPVGGSHA